MGIRVGEPSFTKYPEKEELKCSFCGKPQSQTFHLIAGPSVHICDECVSLCNDILDDQRRTVRNNAIAALKQVKATDGVLIGNLLTEKDVGAIIDAIAAGDVAGATIAMPSR